MKNRTPHSYPTRIGTVGVDCSSIALSKKKRVQVINLIDDETDTENETDIEDETDMEAVAESVSPNLSPQLLKIPKISSRSFIGDKLPPDELPEGILRVCHGTRSQSGRTITPAKQMSTQLKEYHARFSKNIQIWKGSSRYSVWRCTDYVNKERLCKQNGVEFDPSSACPVVCSVMENRYAVLIKYSSNMHVVLNQ